MVQDWKIQDYKARCYNLQNRLTPNKANEKEIERRANSIRRTHKCDLLTALIILKEQLEAEVAKKKPRF